MICDSTKARKQIIEGAEAAATTIKLVEIHCLCNAWADCVWVCVKVCVREMSDHFAEGGSEK